MNEKVLVLGSYVACIASLLLLTFMSQFYILCCARLAYGAAQVVLVSYIAAWVETFTAETQTKALKLHVIMAVQTLSYFIGYAIVGSWNARQVITPTEEVPSIWSQPWRGAIFLQAIFLIFSAFVVLSVEMKYFDFETAKEVQLMQELREGDPSLWMHAQDRGPLEVKWNMLSSYGSPSVLIGAGPIENKLELGSKRDLQQRSEEEIEEAIQLFH